MAGTNYFNSNRSGYSGSMGSGSWNDFYKGITPKAAPPTNNGGYVERSTSPGSPYLTAAEREQLYKTYPTLQPGYAAPTPAPAPAAQPPNVGPGPLPRPGYAPTAIDMAAINAQPAFPIDSAVPIPANPAVAEALAQRLAVPGGVPRQDTLISGENPMFMGQKVRVSPSALIDGRRGKDNEPGANYNGRSLGNDGVVRGYNQDTKRWDNLSANSKPSPSQSYKKDSLGDRDMRQTRKPGPGR